MHGLAAALFTVYVLVSFFGFTGMTWVKRLFARHFGNTNTFPVAVIGMLCFLWAGRVVRQKHLRACSLVLLLPGTRCLMFESADGHCCGTTIPHALSQYHCRLRLYSCAGLFAFHRPKFMTDATNTVDGLAGFVPIHYLTGIGLRLWFVVPVLPTRYRKLIFIWALLPRSVLPVLIGIAGGLRPYLVEVPAQKNFVPFLINVPQTANAALWDRALGLIQIYVVVM